MFKFFVDDSGKEAQDSPGYILAGWMARVDDWERFSDAWEISINADNPKPLAYDRGSKYFKNSHASTQTGCFAGFTPQEAAQKTKDLACLIIGLSPRIAGFSVAVPHDLYKEHVLNKAVTRRGKVRPEQRLPFYVAFSHLIPSVHALHYHAGFRDKIDYIFDGDKTDKPLRHCVEIYKSIKEDFQDEPWYSTMGGISEGDDRDLAPLQVADMFAGQLRQSMILGEVSGAIKYWEQNRVKMVGEYIGREKLDQWSQGQNEEASTRILTAIKNERENPRPRVMSKRREKKNKRE